MLVLGVDAFQFGHLALLLDALCLEDLNHFGLVGAQLFIWHLALRVLAQAPGALQHPFEAFLSFDDAVDGCRDA